MLTFLQQPYPVRDPRYSRAILQALLSGVLIAFILIVFQPFGSYNWQHPYKTLILAGYGMVAVVGNLTDFFVTQKLFRSYFAESNWTLWKEIFRTILGFVLAGFLCVVYGNLAGFMAFTLTQVIYMVAVCFMVGAFPATILILLNYAYLTHKYSSPVVPVQKLQPVNVPDMHTLELIAENEKDKVKLSASDLLCITASDNYCTVFYMEDGKLNKVLLRSSLSRLEGQIGSTRIMRCHRSYLVNLDQVKDVSGNAQGYKLHLENLPEPVPVSRAFNSLVKELVLVC